MNEEPTRESLIGSFCALLELVKLGIVGVEQDARHGEIVLALKEEHAQDMDDVLEQSVLDDEARPETEPPAATPSESASEAEPVLAVASDEEDDDAR